MTEIEIRSFAETHGIARVGKYSQGITSYEFTLGGLKAFAEAIAEKEATPPQYIPSPKCNEVLRIKGESYPRSCGICGLGPCVNRITAH